MDCAALPLLGGENLYNGDSTSCQGFGIIADMTMEESERRVLANMVVYPERAFDLIGRLGIRAEDFSVPSSRAAFAALVRKGVATSEKLMPEVVKCSGE